MNVTHLLRKKKT